MTARNLQLESNRLDVSGTLAWRELVQGHSSALAAHGRTALEGIRQETLKEGTYLVPVRVFIGIGWLRAFAEKAIEPGWRDGTSLATFLEGQLHAGMVALPPYEALVSHVFLPHVLLLGWIVMLGQVLAGVAIMTGSLTTIALLGGIFMNLNFLLAGVPDPSAFYVVIQMVLLLAGTGAVLGIDAVLQARVRSRLLAGRFTGSHASRAIALPTAATIAVLALGCAAYATLHIRDWSPSGSVHDPAAILAVLAVMTASWVVLMAIRGGSHGTTPPEKAGL